MGNAKDYTAPTATTVTTAIERTKDDVQQSERSRIKDRVLDPLMMLGGMLAPKSYLEDFPEAVVAIEQGLNRQQSLADVTGFPVSTLK